MTIVISHCTSDEVDRLSRVFLTQFYQLAPRVSIHQTDPLVRVEVSGGVAEVTSCAAGITVEIINHDDEKPL